MNRGLVPVVLAVLLGGCAPRHHATLQDGTLTLHLRAPEAATVQFASSLDDYALHQATRQADGSWTVAGLPNREFQYFYLVDGTPRTPDCRFRQHDDFGTSNCRYLPATDSPAAAAQAAARQRPGVSPSTMRTE